MRALAEYGGYVDRFALTDEVLRVQGFRRAPPDFHCLVAEGADGVSQGMLVYFLTPSPSPHVRPCT